MEKKRIYEIAKEEAPEPLVLQRLQRAGACEDRVVDGRRGRGPARPQPQPLPEARAAPRA